MKIILLKWKWLENVYLYWKESNQGKEIGLMIFVLGNTLLMTIH